jgi:hypothetical protein
MDGTNMFSAMVLIALSATRSATGGTRLPRSPSGGSSLCIHLSRGREYFECPRKLR